MRVPIEFSTVIHQTMTYSTSQSPFLGEHNDNKPKKHRGFDHGVMLELLQSKLKDLTYRKSDCAAPLLDHLVTECIYLVEALLSRGTIVKCQLLGRSWQWVNFMERVKENFYLNSFACLETLKEILLYIDENILLDCLHETFEKLFNKKKRVQKSFGLSAEEEKEGYVMLRKIVITPTRMILMPSEMVMGNRAVRSASNSSNKHDAFLRISYRDEDGKRLNYWRKNPNVVIRTIIDTFTEGIIVTGKKYYYIGGSSSQQREHGVYFMLGILDSHAAKLNSHSRDHSCMYSILKFRKKLGRFESLNSIPKVMARLGQCFTQSRETVVKIQRHEYERRHDIIGGSNEKGEPYTFSDGVGTVSCEFADKMTCDLSLDSTPGCFQIRFRGMKGVLSVDRFLDDNAAWFKEHGIQSREGSGAKLCMFRYSQEKFVAKRYDLQPLEVVKHSGVSSMCLNKPLIAVLDFATETNKTVHDRIRNRIRSLLDMDLKNIAKQLSSDFHCRQCLRSFPKRINIDLLDERTGLNLFFEPFFRGLLLASAYDSITRQMQKLRIAVPNHLGRGMMGVMDETGFLQSGQVFFQYTSSCSSYNPKRNCATIVHTGPVMITKSPTMVLSDLRLFEAVDIPELHHLRDVIVFPQHGPRPHPDEMAGSDLDGDEYSVIWDPELMLEKNVPAKSYMSQSPKYNKETTKHVDTSNNENVTGPSQPWEGSEMDLEKLNSYCADFFVNVITQDAIGHISNCHLFNADTYHITSKVCESLASKAAVSLDFAKTGIPSERLTRNWTKDINGNWGPPESVEYYPDYSNSRTYRPMYASDRWVGELYREVRKIEEYIADELKEEPVIEIDHLMVEEGWESYEADATFSFNCYLNEIRSVMISYRIRYESELFSGFVRDNAHKMGEKGTDDQSYYNIKQVIDKRVSNIFRKYRASFFEEFGGYRRYTQSKYRYEESTDVLKRNVVIFTPEMKRKASAYYMVAYKHALSTGERFLSFGWLLYEINSDNRLSKILQSPDHLLTEGVHTESIDMRIRSACEKVISSEPQKFESFALSLKTDFNLEQYCSKYSGLMEILFALREWADNLKLLDGRFTEKHLMHLFLAFSLKRFGNTRTTADIQFEEIEKTVPVQQLEEEKVVLEEPYKLLLSFFEFISSLNFKKIESINFSHTGFVSVLTRGEWKPLHEEALKSYYRLLISLKFIIVPTIEDGDVYETIIDGNPFCMLVPEDERDEIAGMLKNASGITEISTRLMNDDTMVVMARGTSSALRKLRDIAVVRVDKYYSSWKAEEHELHDYLIKKTMEKLKPFRQL
ncbi:unnamed protein product [Auanema sp. JU1783]|nr:unnamed protein product [Auanema sp. JU1783]